MRLKYESQQDSFNASISYEELQTIKDCLQFAQDSGVDIIDMTQILSDIKKGLENRRNFDRNFPKSHVADFS